MRCPTDDLKTQLAPGPQEQSIRRRRADVPPPIASRNQQSSRLFIAKVSFFLIVNDVFLGQVPRVETSRRRSSPVVFSPCRRVAILRPRCHCLTLRLQRWRSVVCLWSLSPASPVLSRSMGRCTLRSNGCLVVCHRVSIDTVLARRSRYPFLTSKAILNACNGSRTGWREGKAAWYDSTRPPLLTIKLLINPKDATNLMRDGSSLAPVTRALQQIRTYEAGKPTDVRAGQSHCTSRTTTAPHKVHQSHTELCSWGGLPVAPALWKNRIKKRYRRSSTAYRI